ncbi:EamA family transporter [Breoghania sp.]|uniref:EamA family transporter n=1 Tax=Breoghania sp. TaxID=2065378 RepID=UPI002638CE8C|nr:EamA family transporter [Breoghania sp.]MDJ0930676.1 EamA family transporter [Breoghania sp.]
MTRARNTLLTVLAPAIWGSTYLVTTEALPVGYPITLAVLRVLPAGLLLLLVTRNLPPVEWLGRTFILGALNFALFWSLLFISAYRLPGGVTATLSATQALIVLGLSRALLGSAIHLTSMIAAIAGVSGVAMLVLGPDAALDPIDIAAGLGGAASMAAGTVLSRKWQPPVSALTFTAWQLTAGGILLVPVALILEPASPSLSMANVAGLTWLGLIGAAATYWLWFRGVARIEPPAISMLGMMSPLTAVALGWLWLNQTLTPVQIVGSIVVLGSVWLGQAAARSKGQTPPRCHGQRELKPMTA